MATTEAKVIGAVVKNKDISVIMGEDKELFGAYEDVAVFMREYYLKFKAVPSGQMLEEKFGIEVPDTQDVTKHYMESLRTEFVGSRMETIMEKAALAMQTRSAPDVLAQLQTSLAKLGKYTTNVRDLNLKDADAAEEYFKMLKEQSDANDGTPGIATGFKAIDAAYPQGLSGGHSVVLMGYTGKGKSMFADLLAVNVHSQGKKPMIISLEMTPEEQRERLYAMMSHGIFKISDLARGDVSLDNFREWAKKSLEEASDFIVVSNQGTSEVTPNTIQGKIDSHRPDVLILDYLQLMSDNAKTTAMTPRMLNLSREIKLLAVNNNIPIVSITAVTDEDGDKRDSPPQLSQVSWSKGIEYDANLAIAVHRHTDTDIVEMAGRKNRHGPLFNFGFEVSFDEGIWTERYDLF